MAETALKTVEELARGAGRLLMRRFGRLRAGEVHSKSAARDLVSVADLESERFLLAGLREAFPGDRILSEEDAAGASATGGPPEGPGGRLWVVDPLDGTVNFVQGLPCFAVSIALLVDGRPELAVVHLPRLEECFRAARGRGAACNGRSIRVSSTTRLADAVLATGFPYRRHLLLDNNLENFERLFLRQRGVRRMGSAASDLAYVAAGRLDAFWELHLSPWDVAAGGLLVEEAGGRVDTIVPGGDWIFERNLLAGPAALCEELRAVLRAGRGPDYPPLGERDGAEA